MPSSTTKADAWNLDKLSVSLMAPINWEDEDLDLVYPDLYLPDSASSTSSDDSWDEPTKPELKREECDVPPAPLVFSIPLVAPRPLPVIPLLLPHLVDPSSFARRPLTKRQSTSALHNTGREKRRRIVHLPSMPQLPRWKHANARDSVRRHPQHVFAS